MNIFGGNPAVVNMRTRGDTSALPMRLQITTSRMSAISKLAIGSLFALLGYNNIGAFADQGQQGALIDLAFQFGPLLIALFGLAILAQGAISFSYRKTVTIEDGQVSVSGKSLLGRENWSELLSAFEGVRWREMTVQRRRRMSGNNTHSRGPAIYQVLDLQHHDEKRCIPLYVTRMKAGSERFFKQMSGMIDLKVETRGKLGPLADHIDSLQESTRSRWENFAKLLDVPAIDARDGQQQVRAAADVDKSIKELADEGKISAEWDNRAPPAGLEVVYEGDADNPDAQIIQVTITAKKFPVWVYGAILAFCGFFFLMGVINLALIAVLFGGGIGAGVIWHWKSEEKNLRSVRISRSQLRIETPNPGNATSNEVIDHRDIERVEITRRDNQYTKGRQSQSGRLFPRLGIATDRKEFQIASGVSNEGLSWLRDLILSAVAKA